MPIRRTRRRSARDRADVDLGLRSRLLDLMGQWAMRLTAESRFQSSALFFGALVAFTAPALIVGLPQLSVLEHPRLQAVAARTLRGA